MGNDSKEEEEEGPPMSVVAFCAGLAVVLIVGGAICIIVGGSNEGDIGAQDPATLFQSLGKTCNITAIYHVAKSKRVEENCGNDCSATVDLCQDTVSYGFTHGDDTVSYTSRKSVTERNRKKITFAVGGALGSAADDRCTVTPGGGNYAYVGHLPVPVKGPPEECPSGPASCKTGT